MLSKIMLSKISNVDRACSIPTSTMETPERRGFLFLLTSFEQIRLNFR